MIETSTPSAPSSCLLPQRGIITIAGDDRVTFLQGLVSNDVRKATAQQAVYAALLTPQGKFLYEMFIIATPDTLWLDVETAHAEALVARLNKYKLRSAVTITNVSADYGVIADFSGASAASGTICFPDPRLPVLGWRTIAPRALLPAEDNTGFILYDRLRLSLGIADGSRDLIMSDSILLEGNFDYNNGIDFTKGCYMGQELTARTHYRGLIKKRLFPVHSNAEACPPSGTILTENGQEIGTMRSSQGNLGLALIKCDKVANQAMITGEQQQLTASVPTWLKPS
jgi:folate-binding protein YgfZ